MIVLYVFCDFYFKIVINSCLYLAPSVASDVRVFDVHYHEITRFGKITGCDLATMDK